MKTSIPLFIYLSVVLSGCAFKTIVREKKINYADAVLASRFGRQELNIFAPKKRSGPCDVLIFIHGGSWNSGKKSTYNFYGSRMARKGVVVVIIDYPLSPQANYNDMATAAAKSIRWVYQNIGRYGGNPEKIFVSGHSAGGHLAALIAIRHEYFDSLGIKNPIKGAVLIDAAGLDMYGYLLKEKFPSDHTYFKTFTRNPEEWKAATPMYHLHQDIPPLLIYRGEKTYPSIIESHEKFIGALRDFVPDPQYKILKRKKHVPMITQFFKPWNPRYKEIIGFMKER